MSLRQFGGVLEQVLIDNPNALVTHHDSKTREVAFNDRFLAFVSSFGYPQSNGIRQRIIDRRHLEGIVGITKPDRSPKSVPTPPPEPKGELLRPLPAYEAVAGGA